MPLTDTVSFPVEGMTCASCVNRITRSLRKIDGVLDATVNLATESATIRFDRDRTGLPAITAAVETAGYVPRLDLIAAQEQPPAGPERTFAERHLVDLGRRLVVAALLTTPILGEAIVRFARQDRGLQLADATSFEATSGQGIRATVRGQEIAVGRPSFLGVDVESLRADAERLAGAGKTPVFVAIDGHVSAVIAIADTLKPGSAAAVAELHRLGLTVVMLTGDNLVTATAIAAEVGVDRILADVRPDEKAAQIRSLQSEGLAVAMVGDGVNDAPALASADVGIAMGTGTDVAMESAAVTLMSGDLRGLVTAIALSRATMRNIKENLFWAFAYNVALIPLAAGVLFPINGWLLDPIFAAAAMALSSVTVVTNALRLRRFRSPQLEVQGGRDMPTALAVRPT